MTKMHNPDSVCGIVNLTIFLQPYATPYGADSLESSSPAASSTHTIPFLQSRQLPLHPAFPPARHRWPKRVGAARRSFFFFSMSCISRLVAFVGATVACRMRTLGCLLRLNNRVCG